MSGFLLLTSAFFVCLLPATSEIYTLSLHDALPICGLHSPRSRAPRTGIHGAPQSLQTWDSRRNLTFVETDRKSTRLNSSHSSISYAVFCLKKKIHSANYIPTSL